MMIRIDGKEYTGNSSQELLDSIRKSNRFTEELSLEEYMRDLRKRLFRITGVLLFPTDYDGFIATMIKHDIAERLEL